MSNPCADIFTRMALAGRKRSRAYSTRRRILFIALTCASECVCAQQSLESASELQAIVVTASKRSENLQDVPLAITAISGDALQAQGVSNFSEYLGLVPGLADYSGGVEGHGTVILRGLNTGYYSTSSTVGFYVDDTPYSASSSAGIGTVLDPVTALVDIDHIEVLKGPQGTLYGASALGGLIKVVTNKPNLHSTSGSVRTDVSSVDNGGLGYGFEGVLNLPIIQDTLSLRVSAFDRRSAGYMTNTTIGTKDRGASEKYGARAALRWVPRDNLDIQLSAFVQQLHSTGFAYEFVNLQTLSPVGGEYTYQSPFDPTFRTTTQIYNLSVNYTVGELGTLTNSTSYTSYRDLEFEDYTPFAASVFNPYAPAPVPANAAMPLLWGPSLNKFTEEFRFSSNRTRHFEWMTGLYFTNENSKFPNTYTNIIPPSLAPIEGPSGVVLDTAGAPPAIYKEGAVFGNLTYYLTDTWDVTAGGRYSHNTQERGSGSTGFLGSGQFSTIGTSGSDFTYQAVLRWRASKDLNLYARYATGYRPGGPQRTSSLPGLTSFGPDTVDNYELGAKGLWLDNTLSTNLAVYYMNWHDIQVSSITPDGLGTFILNSGRATVKGVEVETQWAPISSLTLRGTLAYTHALLSFVPESATEVIGAASGDRLPYSPKWSGSLTADYSIPLNESMNVRMGATYRYQGSKISDYPGDTLNTGVQIPAYGTVDLRAAVEWTKYTAEFRVQNAASERGYQTVVDQRFSPSINPPVWAAIIPPRTLVLALSAKF